MSVFYNQTFGRLFLGERVISALANRPFSFSIDGEMAR